MKLHRMVSAGIGLFLMIGLCNQSDGQERPTGTRELSGEAGQLRRQAVGLRMRMMSGAKEGTIYTGQLFDKKGQASPVRIIQQPGAMVRMEGFKGRESVMSFNGRMAKGLSSQGSEDEALMEVFVMDSVEGMLASLQQGAAMQFFGSGFGPDPLIEPDYQGPRYDIYEVTGPVLCRQDKLFRRKTYYFDTASGLLSSTRYYDHSVAPPVKMETRYSVWENIGGSWYPARIEHYRNGSPEFTFIAESVEQTELADTAIFD